MIKGIYLFIDLIRVFLLIVKIELIINVGINIFKKFIGCFL